MTAHPSEQGKRHSQWGGMSRHDHGFLVRQLNIEHSGNHVGSVGEYTPDPYKQCFVTADPPQLPRTWRAFLMGGRQPCQDGWPWGGRLKDPRDRAVARAPRCCHVAKAARTDTAYQAHRQMLADWASFVSSVLECGKGQRAWMIMDIHLSRLPPVGAV